MTEDEADRVAEERNLQYGRSRQTNRYAVPVQEVDGTWSVQERKDQPAKKGIVERILDALGPM